MTDDTLMLIGIAALGGILLGTIWGRWATWSYIASKGPDGVGWRTAFHLRGKFYYVVTEAEYVDKVMGPPSHLYGEGMRVEQGPGYTRFSSGMPPRDGAIDITHRQNRP